MIPDDDNANENSYRRKASIKRLRGNRTMLAGAGSPLNAQELSARGQHPRLFFTPEQISYLQERISATQGTSHQRNP